ncbi:MAG: hypothetical protein HWD61_15655 [Parachlamydiaceae bacterium]|nr:MAG: hypothetical protein HWD61_15655 [Parachlamydiaceae bacterium]
MKQLLEAPFDPNFVSMQFVNARLSSIFTHMERHIWKLFLVLEDGFTNKITALKGWMAENDRYPRCKGLIDQYETMKLSKSKCQEMNENYQKFFKSAQNQQYAEASLVFDQMKDFAIGMLLLYTDLSPEEICEELPYLNEGQIFAACRDPSSREKIQEAFNYGISHNKLPGKPSPVFIFFLKKVQNI